MPSRRRRGLFNVLPVTQIAMCLLQALKRGVFECVEAVCLKLHVGFMRVYSHSSSSSSRTSEDTRFSAGHMRTPHSCRLLSHTAETRKDTHIDRHTHTHTILNMPTQLYLKISATSHYLVSAFERFLLPYRNKELSYYHVITSMFHFLQDNYKIMNIVS